MLSTSSLHILFHSTPLVLLLHLILIRFLCKCWKLKDMLNAVTLNTPLFFFVFTYAYTSSWNYSISFFNFLSLLLFFPMIAHTQFSHERGVELCEKIRKRFEWVVGWIDWFGGREKRKKIWKMLAGKWFLVTIEL